MKFSEYWKEVKELTSLNNIEISEIENIDKYKDKCKQLWNRDYCVEEAFELVFDDLLG